MTRLRAVAAAGVAAALSTVPALAWAQPAALAGERPAATSSAIKPAGVAPSAVPALVLAPTNHPRLPLDASYLWLAPSVRGPRPNVALAGAVVQLQGGNESQALATLSLASTQEGLLGHYALYYAGRAQQALGKQADALRTFRLLQQRQLVGYLKEAVAIGEAEALEVTGEHAAAADIYDRLSKEKPLALDDVLLRLGREAEAAGQTERAIEAYLRVYYEFPLGELAPSARARLDAYPNFAKIAPGSERFRLELGRAQRLFGAKQYAPAKSIFDTLRGSASGDDRALVDVRIAESDYYLKRYRAARDGIAPYTDSGPRRAEALYFAAIASRALGDNATYLRNLRTVIDTYPDQTWAEEALNHLATQYVRQDDDDAADTVFRELIQRYPRSPFSERAVWKVGWRAYRQGRYVETAQLFERAAVDFPRSDYRPAWLFWAGRAHAESKRPELAEARFTLTSLDYLNSYYGRLAVTRLQGRIPAPRVVTDVSAPVTAPPPNDAIVRALLEVELYDDALNELKFIQRNWGDSPTVQATTSWIYRQQGLSKTGREQFNLLRGSITLMRRAYPQFMAAGGEYLPRDVLSHIFPIAYWDLIQKHAGENGLDPYFVAALMAQESTFVADIRSPANAVGLMQLIPSTARMYARRLKLPYSAKLMTNPEANIRMGTAYLADKIREFGEPHLALASYNAGERAVRRWLSERPGVPADEFIDDIPYPETQNYVKRIMGTADDYRRIYGGAAVPPLRLQSEASDAVPPSTAAVSTATGERLVDSGAVSAVTAATPVKPEPKKKAAPKAAPKAPRKPVRKSRAVKTSATGTSRIANTAARRAAPAALRKAPSRKTPVGASRRTPTRG